MNRNTIEHVWNNSTIAQRQILAKSLGYRTEWARLRYEELPLRGGGMLQKDLARLYQLRLARMKR